MINAAPMLYVIDIAVKRPLNYTKRAASPFITSPCPSNIYPSEIPLYHEKPEALWNHIISLADKRSTLSYVRRI